MNECLLRGARNRSRDLGHKYVTDCLADSDGVGPPGGVAFLFGLATWPTLDRIREVAETLAKSWDTGLYDPLEEVIQVTNLETGETEGFIEIKEGRVRSWFSEGSAASQPNDPKDVQEKASEPPKEEETEPFRCGCGSYLFTSRIFQRREVLVCDHCHEMYAGEGWG